MEGTRSALRISANDVLETLPPVWDSIRSKLRSAGMTRFGITLEQFHVLRHIRQGVGTVGELAQEKQVSRSAVSQAVNVLVGKGLVTRRTETADRRCVHLELTPHAVQVLDRNHGETAAWMEAAMAGLSGRELASLRTAMKILRDTFAPVRMKEKEH